MAVGQKVVRVSPRKSPALIWSREKREGFLAVLAETANVRMAVSAVGMSSAGLYKLKKRDAGFARAWGEALCDGFAKLELLMLQRAIEGLEPDRVAEGDGSMLIKLSERGILTLLNQHRQTVRELRGAAGSADDRSAREADKAARAQLRATLDLMNERLAAVDSE